MPKVFDYDPFTGVETLEQIIEKDRGAEITLHHRQDVEPLLDYASAVRNHGGTEDGIKDSMWHYATIPLAVVMELKKKGIDVYRREDHRRMIAELNANYPHLKLTNKTHSIS